MLVDNGLSPEKKIETQQKIIEQFEKEKQELLQTIDSLTFEKNFDKENNEKSITLAKSLIETMEKQMNELSDCIKELNYYKDLYRKNLVLIDDMKQHYSSTMDKMLSNVDSASMQSSPIKKFISKIKVRLFRFKNK